MPVPQAAPRLLNTRASTADRPRALPSAMGWGGKGRGVDNSPSTSSRSRSREALALAAPSGPPRGRGPAQLLRSALTQANLYTPQTRVETLADAAAASAAAAAGYCDEIARLNRLLDVTRERAALEQQLQQKQREVQLLKERQRQQQQHKSATAAVAPIPAEALGPSITEQLRRSLELDLRKKIIETCDVLSKAYSGAAEPAALTAAELEAALAGSAGAGGAAGAAGAFAAAGAGAGAAVSVRPAAVPAAVTPGLPTPPRYPPPAYLIALQQQHASAAARVLGQLGDVKQEARPSPPPTSDQREDSDGQASLARLDP